MTMSTTRPRLHVIASLAEPERWRTLVAEVAALVGMEPVVELPPPGRAQDVQGILTVAAEMDGAVLVLPNAALTAAGGAVRAARLERLLVPIDRSRAEDAVLRPLILRALEQGMAVDQIHLLTQKSQPPMWEGPGHHAQAWHDELHRRHRVGTARLQVRGGQPSAVLGELGGRADLVVVCWGGQVEAGRPKVVREILAGVVSPVLLLKRPAPGLSHGRH
jgi:hypothetical protein